MEFHVREIFTARSSSGRRGRRKKGKKKRERLTGGVILSVGGGEDGSGAGPAGLRREIRGAGPAGLGGLMGRGGRKKGRRRVGLTGLDWVSFLFLSSFLASTQLKLFEFKSNLHSAPMHSTKTKDAPA